MLSLRERTMLGNVPGDWAARPLRDLLKVHYPGDWGDDAGPNMAKVIRSTNLTNDGCLDLTDVALRALPPTTVSLLSPLRDDILLERSGGGPGQPVGRVGFVVADMPGHAFSNFLHLLRPNPNEIDPRFLAWILYRVNRSGCIVRLEQQTTQMRNLHFRDYLTMSLPVPPREERIEIARILDTVDDAVQQARGATEKAAHLRVGLLQSAFEFKNTHGPMKPSELGPIPPSWEAIKGKQAFAVATGGWSSVDSIRRPRDGAISDAWFMKVDDFNSPANRRGIYRTSLGFRSADNPRFKLHQPGTVIIAKRGAAILKNRVRKSFVPIALDPNLMALQALPGIRPDFLRMQLEWRKLSRYVEDSGIPQLNNKDLYPRWFLRAPDSAQEEIIRVIAAVESYEDALLARADALEDLKKGLMQDLLTGTVRMPVHEDELRAVAS